MTAIVTAILAIKADAQVIDQHSDNFKYSLEWRWDEKLHKT